MTTADALARDPMRLGAALRLVLRRYGKQIRRRPAIALPALILPGVASALIFYAPPLVVAKVPGAFARAELPTASNPLRGQRHHLHRRWSHGSLRWMNTETSGFWVNIRSITRERFLAHPDSRSPEGVRGRGSLSLPFHGRGKVTNSRKDEASCYPCER